MMRTLGMMHPGRVIAVILMGITGQGLGFDLVEIERERIQEKAARYLKEEPRTVTADVCERSQGGPHDFYSEGDYWWPDPSNPDAPYIRRDGETNPDNFIAHRRSMIRLSDIIGTLASAYVITQDETFAAHGVAHLKAWFVDEETRMNPSLLYGQAIKGRESGRSIGVIDTIHLVEVARGVKVLLDSPSFAPEDQAAVKQWFRDYLAWLNTHPYGIQERSHPNNHGVCWSLQAGAFADLVGDDEQLEWIREQFKTVYLKEMMNQEGGFPAELARTKPYGYSLFMIDAMAGVAQLASTPDDDLWKFELPDGRGMKKGLEFIIPYIIDKESWTRQRDVMYWEEWPVRHPSVLFAGLQYERQDYLDAWKKFEADPKVFEVLRNLPIRHPLLWVGEKPHVVYVLAEREYETAQTVPKFHEEIMKPLGYRATFIIVSDEDGARNDLSGLAEALETADLCFLSVRRRAPAEKDMQALIDFVAAGKPIVAIKTSSHAFHLRGESAPAGHQLWETFDAEILGGNYRGHYGEEPAAVSVVEGAQGHPILAGVGPLPATSKLYQTGPLRETATALLMGEIDGQAPEPVAWTHLAGENRAKVFYTSLGAAGEFENAAFRRLLANAVGWALARE